MRRSSTLPAAVIDDIISFSFSIEIVNHLYYWWKANWYHQFFSTLSVTKQPDLPKLNEWKLLITVV